jgi:hypothetical protein
MPDDVFPLCNSPGWCPPAPVEKDACSGMINRPRDSGHLDLTAASCYDSER